MRLTGFLYRWQHLPCHFIRFLPTFVWFRLFCSLASLSWSSSPSLIVRVWYFTCLFSVPHSCLHFAVCCSILLRSLSMLHLLATSVPCIRLWAPLSLYEQNLPMRKWSRRFFWHIYLHRRSLTALVRYHWVSRWHTSAFSFSPACQVDRHCHTSSYSSSQTERNAANIRQYVCEITLVVAYWSSTQYLPYCVVYNYPYAILWLWSLFWDLVCAFSCYQLLLFGRLLLLESLRSQATRPIHAGLEHTTHSHTLMNLRNIHLLQC